MSAPVPNYEQRVFTVVEAAAELKISKSYLYELAKAGKIELTKLGKRTLIKGSDLVAFIKKL
jgi:excisionase family DNA binding protein